MLESVAALTSESDCIWYLMLGAHHEGPFSRRQVFEKIDQGELSHDTLAWSAELTDWQPLATISTFSQRLVKSPYGLFTQGTGELSFDESATNTAAIPTTAASELSFSPPDMSREIIEAGSAIPTTSNDGEWERFIQNRPRFITLPPPPVAPKPPLWWQNTKWQLSAVGLCLVSSLVCLAVAFWNRGEILPYFDEISMPENRELQAAASARLRQGGVVAMGLANTNEQAPSFLLGTNLPDGTRLDISIDGVPETLVERFKVSVRAFATVKDHVAHTPPFRQDNGQAFPRGEYRVTISCSTCDVALASKTLAQKSYFLGGHKDADYDQKLKTHHERLRAQAVEELAELKQLGETLDNQLKGTSKHFQDTVAILHQHPDRPSPGAAWNQYDGQWRSLQEQLDAVFARWTPEALDAAFFEAPLYALLKKTGAQVNQLHDLEVDYLTSGRSTTDTASVAQATEIDAQIAHVTIAMETLLQAIDHTEHLPATANGMPAR